jgi:predicted nucleic acid-binding Zn ribbon protein
MERPEAALAWLGGVWPSVVGKALAVHTKPVRCDSGCLEIATDGKPWRNQLESMKREFCARVNQAWGGNLIREVKFVAMKRTATGPEGSAPPGAERLPHELDNEHIPFIRRRRS